jgi:aminoglycoside phosphotransferase (APT) family kinase protein
VARDPASLLSLHLCSHRWLDEALPTLLQAADPRLLDGDALCHLDVRSDNLCFRDDGQAVLVDWNFAAVGNAEFDVAFWLPSLRAEGGPAPQEVAGGIDPGVVALVAGFFASRAGLPVIPAAPRVRHVQRVQLEVALPWAAAVLGLPALDHPRPRLVSTVRR